MCRRATFRRFVGRITAAGAILALPGAWAQSRLDWRHIGNSAIDLPSPSLATGPVDRVWYSADGSALYAHTLSGRIFETTTFDQWKRVSDSRIIPPNHENPAASTVPEQ